jgi:hypothetical protein
VKRANNSNLLGVTTGGFMGYERNSDEALGKEISVYNIEERLKKHDELNALTDAINKRFTFLKFRVSEVVEKNGYDAAIAKAKRVLEILDSDI